MKTKVPGEPVNDAYRRSIEDYYEETFVDYRALWINSENRALHMGFWDDQADDHARSLIRANEVLAELAGIKPGARILDAGSGLGGSSIWLHKTFDAEVTGLTLSHDQVIRSRRYAAEAGIDDKVSFEKMDYSKTSFEDNTFDIVWAQESLCHALDKEAAISEFFRVLKPGGTVAITDFFVNRSTATARGDDKIAQWLDGWRMPHLLTSERAEDFIKSSGFVDFTTTDTTDWITPSFQRLYRLTMYLRPALWAMERRNLRSPLQIGNTVGSRAAYQALKKGLWRGAILTGKKPGAERGNT